MSSVMTSMRTTPANVDEKLKKKLITILLKVYMSGRFVSRFIVESAILRLYFPLNSEPSIDKASRLLNTQAMNLDASEVSWSIRKTWRVLLIRPGFRFFR